MNQLKFVVSRCWLFLFLMVSLLPKSAMAVDWPQEVSVAEGIITVYQPQPESLVGNILQGRAAMSILLKNSKEPVFGAFWFSARIDTDHDTKMVTIRDIKVTKVGWPDSKEAGEARFTEIANRELATSTFKISTDRLSASLATAQKELTSLEGLKNDPPKIIFSDTLSVLLLYDGPPRFMDVENSSYERAVNTPFAVVRDKRTKKAYLSSSAFWYVADDVLGPWSVTQNPPADLLKIIPQSKTKEAAPTTAPLILVATEPTELIVSIGKPNWQSLVGGKIMYVKNTETPWLREISENKIYVLLSGRWFAAPNEAGPWQFVRPDQVPASFKEIPPGSDIGGVRVSIAGTKEADDAMLEAQIPQTAAINRSKAKFTAQYDGEPKFEAIPGTKVSYAVNTGSQILLIHNIYYAVDNGVWFTSKSPKGPWVVADKIPKEEIDEIPPSSPVYNTTYVEIYESTPEVVYVGYTPGYMWSYPYYGVPYYGTGYYYPPYYGSYYYPRPPTWGLHVGYNPWTGWNFGVSWSNGFFSIGMTFGAGYGGYHGPAACCGGWYGGAYNRSPVVVNTGDINIGNSVHGGNRNLDNRRQTASTRPSNTRNNVYQRSENRNRNADVSRRDRSSKIAQPKPQKPNDVFADRQGNVARDNNGQWQARENGEWRSARDDLGLGSLQDRDTRVGAEASRSGTEPSRSAGEPSRSGAETSRSVDNRSSRSNIDRQSLDSARSARNHGRSMERASRGFGGRRR